MKSLFISLVTLMISANAFALNCRVYKGGQKISEASGENLVMKLNENQDLLIKSGDSIAWLSITRPPNQQETEFAESSGDVPGPISLASIIVSHTGKTTEVLADLLDYTIQCFAK